MAGFWEYCNKLLGFANVGHMSKYYYSEVALAPTYINPKHAAALPYTKRLQTTHLCVLRLRKNPSSLRACSLISWLSAASNLKIVRTPCLMSKAGTIEAGCSDMRDISICSTSWRFSSCNKTQYYHQSLQLSVPCTMVSSSASHLEGLRLKSQSSNVLFWVSSFISFLKTNSAMII